MSHPINMLWQNELESKEDALSFTNPTHSHGTDPKPSNFILEPQGSSTVSADQSHNLSPGPVGSYTWANSQDTSKKIDCQYNHPAGSGTTTVTVNCSGGYEVSDDKKTYHTSHVFSGGGLAHHTANITLYFRKV